MMSHQLSARTFSGASQAGNLFLLGYKDEIPVVPLVLPAAKPNVVDLVCPPCWRAIAFPAGRWRAWDMAACWAKMPFWASGSYQQIRVRLRFPPPAR